MQQNMEAKVRNNKIAKKKWKGEFLYCEIVPGKGRQKQTKEKRQDKVLENKTP